MSDPLFAECVDAEHRDAYNVDVDDAICTLPVRDEAAFICSVEEAVEAGRWRSALLAGIATPQRRTCAACTTP